MNKIIGVTAVHGDPAQASMLVIDLQDSLQFEGNQYVGVHDLVRQFLPVISVEIGTTRIIVHFRGRRVRALRRVLCTAVAEALMLADELPNEVRPTFEIMTMTRAAWDVREAALMA